MFTDPGKKIKFVVRVLFPVDLVLCFIAWLFWFASALSLPDSDATLVLLEFIFGFLLSAFGVWVLCLLVYGFGELVDKTSKTEEKVDKLFTHF